MDDSQKSENSPDEENSDSSLSAELSENLKISASTTISSPHGLSSHDDQSRPISRVNNPETPAHSHILPTGWLCNYDSDNDEYKFEFKGNQNETEKSRKDEAIMATTPTVDHQVQTSRRPTTEVFECKYGYHFPSSPTSSMISELAKQVQKNSSNLPSKKGTEITIDRTKLMLIQDGEEQTKRIKEMFPTATEQVIEQMIKIYHGREGLIKAALISLGYKRASEYSGQPAAAQSPIMLMMAKPSSRKLFDKLKSYFPDKDENVIKNMMYKYKEVEHDVISGLVEYSQSSGAIESGSSESQSRDLNEAIMKLRYLKFLFPSCQEIELYHLLHCNDLNAQKVIEKVESRGHKRANIEEVMENRKSQAQQLRNQQAALAAKDKASNVNLVEQHLNRKRPVLPQSRIETLKDNLKKHEEITRIEDALLEKALECADYNEPLAKRLLEGIKPIDEEAYKHRYQIPRTKEAQVVLFPCKATQKDYDGSFIAVSCLDYVSIPREVIESNSSLALTKSDACTFTQDDFETPRFTHAEGKKLDLAAGPKLYLGPKDSARIGATIGLRDGSKIEQIRKDNSRAIPGDKAKGHNRELSRGSNSSMRCGHNRKLIQRTHPFFEKSRAAAR